MGTVNQSAIGTLLERQARLVILVHLPVSTAPTPSVTV